MASGYTTNYGLCQWEGEDPFVRTEFNADNAKVDAAIHGLRAEAAQAAAAADTKAQRALDGLRPVSYNVYNLMLQRYYEGKSTGFKRALAFDGFLNWDQVNWCTPNLSRIPTTGGLLLGGDAATEFDSNYGNESSKSLSAGQTASVTWTASGTASVTGVSIHMTGQGQLSVTGPEGETLGSAQMANGTAAMSFSITLGAKYTFTFTAAGAVTLGCFWGSNAFGFKLSVQNALIVPGNLRSITYHVGQRYPNVRAWVRHNLDQPAKLAMSVEVGGAMEQVSIRQTINLAGESCFETEFALSWQAYANEAFTVHLDLATYVGMDLKVYDYGIMIL